MFFIFSIIVKLKTFKNKNNLFFKTSVFLLIVHFLTSLTETTLMKEHGFLFLTLLGLSIGYEERLCKKSN